MASKETVSEGSVNKPVAIVLTLEWCDVTKLSLDKFEGVQMTGLWESSKEMITKVVPSKSKDSFPTLVYTSRPVIKVVKLQGGVGVVLSSMVVVKWSSLF